MAIGTTGAPIGVGVGHGHGRRHGHASRRFKVVGPAVGCVAFVAAAAVEWPVGAVVYIFGHMKGGRIMAHPSTVVYPRVSRAIPI